MMNVSQPHASARYPSVPVARLVGHDGPIQAVRFTEDGKYCLTGGLDRSVRLWNPSRLDPKFPPRRHHGDDSAQVAIPVDGLPQALPIQVYKDGITHGVSALAVESASSTLISASERTLVASDLLTQQAKRRFTGHTGRINAVAISENAETFLSASYDATVRIWDGRSRTHEPIQTLKEAKDSVTDVHVVQNDHQTWIRTSSVDGCLRTYDLRKGIVKIDDVSSPITSMSSTRDGQYIALSCLDGVIRLVEAESGGELVNSYEGSHVAGQYGLGVCVSADDGTIVTGGEDGQCVLYDLVRAKCVQKLIGHTQPTCAVAAHPINSAVVVTGSFDGNAVVWANSPDFMGWQDSYSAS